MGKRSSVIVLLALGLCYMAAEAGCEAKRSCPSWDEHPFILQERKEVFKTEAGEMSFLKGGGWFGGRITEKSLRIGFITMEPKSLFIPHYIDNDLIIFIRKGEARLGHIYKDDFLERRLKIGDVYRIPGGSPFYLVNVGEGQRLHIICSIESNPFGWDTAQLFFIGGGTYPSSILSGFDRETLATAFNVSTSELSEILTRQQQGPIVFLPDSHSPSTWTKFLQLEHQEKKQHLRTMLRFQQEEDEGDEDGEEKSNWSLRMILDSIFKSEDNKKWIGKKALDSYNLYNRKPDYRNAYGWSIALDHKEYSPLGRSDIGVFLVNLTAGSMMAPHINPTATEYGIVLSGAGTIQIVYPNGTLAMNTRVKEGDVFWIPRFFPFCQIASRSGPFEFFGFTTSAKNNHPQFLVGASSILQTMRGPELAAGFGMSDEKFGDIIDAQRESTILPTVEAAPPDKKVRNLEKEADVVFD